MRCSFDPRDDWLTDCAIQEVRTISHLLHPPLLEELGFLPAARWYVDEYGKRGQIKVSLIRPMSPSSDCPEKSRSRCFVFSRNH